MAILKIEEKSSQDEKFSCIKCGSVATWYYIPCDHDEDEEYDIKEDFFCDDCVSRGCSCNDESISFDNERDNIDELLHQAQSLRNDINQNDYVMLNYGMAEHCSGKELETITDIKQIRAVINNITDEQMRHFTFKPLDEKGRMYPCCEFDYSKDGYLISDFSSESEEENVIEKIIEVDSH